MASQVPNSRLVEPSRPSIRRTAQPASAGSAAPALGDAAVRELVLAATTALAIMSPIVGVGGWLTYDAWKAQEEARLTAIFNAQAHERLVAAEPGPMLPVAETAHGRDLFAITCTGCHGADGKGVTGLGKDLTQSDFVALQSDELLHAFIVSGRPDAKPVPMPPKAGRADLTDDEIGALVSYVRALQDPRRRPELPPPAPVAPPAPDESQKALALAAAGGDAELAGYIAHGDALFNTVCIACHGKGGVGIKGNGKALAANEFVKSLDDDALLAFVKQGRGPTDPKNTTGIQMPPKGGNPALSDDDILDVIAYLRTLQAATPPAASGS